MKTSTNGINLIKRHEGLRLTAYRCAANVLTIGYGHTGADVKEGMKITAQRADQLLLADLATAETVINRELPKLTQNQFDALVSFVFNVGVSQFQSSTLLKKAKANANDATIRGEFAKWKNGGGKVLPGLVARRKDEADLYFK